MTAVLPACAEKGVRILTNMGAANPEGAAAAVRRLARSLGLTRLRVAAITGDDVLALVMDGAYRLDETGQPVLSLGSSVVSANAYLGVEPLLRALTRGADVIIAGRVADPSLFLAPMVHEFGWSVDDWMMLGRGTVVGHLLECAGQVTGGYFADPGMKDVADLERLGFPLAEVSGDGSAIITKVAGSGGLVTPATCKEQLLYEIHDPAEYMTPDVTADFSRVQIEPAGADRVHVSGGDGRSRPATLKVSVAYRDGFAGEGQIAYAGPAAVERARLAARIVASRFRQAGLAVQDARFDLIGIDSLHGAVAAGPQRPDPYEVRLRVAGRTATMADARRIGNEVETLYTNGPAGGGGVTTAAKEILAMGTTFVPRSAVQVRVDDEERA